MTLSDLVNQHIGLSFRKQYAMEDFLGESTWRLDHANGRIDFGKGPGLFARRRTYPIQILGTEDENAATWRWAWANTQSGFPPGILKAAERVRSLGESEGVAELVTAELPSSEYPGHLLACVAAGITDADCYYPGNIPGGACFMLIFETPLRQAPPTDPVRIIRVLTQVTCAFGVDHRAMARAYLDAEELRIVDEGLSWSAADEAGRLVRIDFDDMGRIKRAMRSGRPAS
ncbi:MAG: DUF6882 domain-containing protein [Isosphaeraceae bacterium]